MDEIHQAYRHQARKHHPDLGGDAWAFQQVQNAYEVLIAKRENKPGKNDFRSAAKSENSHGGETSGSHQRSSHTTGKQRHPFTDKTSSQSGTGSTQIDSAERSNQHSNQNASPSQDRPHFTAADRIAARTSPSSSRIHRKSAWKWMFTHQLPLQTETTTFIFVSVLDIFMTYILMHFGAIEANPIANFFFSRWNIRGLIGFKLIIVSVVCLIAQAIVATRPRTARGLLVAGTLITGAVVVYSIRLLVIHI